MNMNNEYCFSSSDFLVQKSNQPNYFFCLDEYCIFPFKVSNLTLTGCTKVDGDTNAWCATKVDSQVQIGVFESNFQAYSQLSKLH